MHVVGEDDPGVDVKGCAGAHSANRIAQCVDIRHQQVRAPIKQVYGKEEGPAWNPIAAIIRHPGSMHARAERRNALRCSALPLLRHGSYAPPPSATPAPVVAKTRNSATRAVPSGFSGLAVAEARGLILSELIR